MSRIPSVAPPPSSSRPLDAASTINELQLEDFFDLMIAELQNQDPLNPLENHELLQQISQIREVGATDRLTETLDAVLLGQNVASATGLLGSEVRALTDDGQNVVGVVDRITISDGQPRLHLTSRSFAEPHTAEGELAEGTYRYQVTYQRPDDRVASIALGPVETTGTNGLDAAVRLANLPQTNGPKSVYRTDETGQGEFRLVGIISDGNVQEYIDTTASENRSAATVTPDTVREFGATELSVTLNNVQQIERRRQTE